MVASDGFMAAMVARIATVRSINYDEHEAEAKPAEFSDPTHQASGLVAQQISHLAIKYTNCSPR